MRFAQLCDLVETGGAAAVEINVSALAGTWVNANPDTEGIARVLLSESGGKLSLGVYAVGPEGLIDWGAADVKPFASGPSSRVVAGFECLYDLGFAEVRLLGMIMKGLLVLAQFHVFKDDSGRADFFAREYFALSHGRY
jgi:hypothetical protein